MPITEKCIVFKNQKLSETQFDLTVAAPEIAAQAKPGQFVTVSCGKEFTLRRPISICDINGDMLRLVFEIRGDGTRNLAEAVPGDTLDILGPLGNGVFPIEDSDEPVLLVGGGIGAPPMLYAAHNLNKSHAVLGFQNASKAILYDEFSSICELVQIATDDGSLGAHGTVAGPISLLLEKYSYSKVFACGPRPMLKAVAELAKEHGIPCFVSMEERMGCGVGACLVCACKTHDKESGEEHYDHVCSNGPVFPAEKIVW